jgi:nucleotide-binding universal stress UspA family protein
MAAKSVRGVPAAKVQPRKKSASASAPRAGGLSRVLLPTDFSAEATRALRRAARLPYAANGQLTLLHVLPEGGSGAVATRAGKAAHVELVKAGAEARRALAAAGAGQVQVRTELGRGKSEEEILRHARELSADLVVIGRTGAGRLRRMLIGSTAERVARRGEAPVLVIGPRRLRAYSNLVLGTDFSPASARAVELSLQVAEPDASVELVHAWEAPFELALYRGNASKEEFERYREECRRTAEAAAEKFLAPFGERARPWTVALRKDNPAHLLKVRAEEGEADLVAVGSRGLGRLGELVLGSVSREMLHSAPCDVLIVPPAAS